MRQVAPVQSRNQARAKTYMDPRLDTAMHVFVRTNAARIPLQPTYRGLYSLVEKWAKYIKIDINGKVTAPPSID